MATRPSVSVINSTAPAPSGRPVDTDTWFVVVEADRGPTDVAVKVTSLSQYETTFGEDVSYGYGWKALDVFFREGGAQAYVVREVGDAPIRASLDLEDGTDPSIKVSAKHYGAYGNDLKVAVIDDGATNHLEVYDGTTLLEAGATVATKAEMLAQTFTYVTLSSLAGTGLPEALASTSLASGTDDRATIDQATHTAALLLFLRALGPGRVSQPGLATFEGHAALLAHASANDRVAILDIPNTGTVATITAETVDTQNDANSSYGAIFGPWVTVPSPTAGATHTVPYSAVQAGVEARRDRVGSEAVPAAGLSFPLQYVQELNYEFSDADRETLLFAGVNLAKDSFGTLVTYGYRSAVDPDEQPEYDQFQYSNLRMAITAKCLAAGDNFLFDIIDGAGTKQAEFATALTGILIDYYGQGLYGETPSEAFSVNTGPSVNTVESLADGELRAVVALRMSPHAEMVVIELVKTAITQSV